MKEKDAQLMLGSLRVALKDASKRCSGTSAGVNISAAANAIDFSEEFVSSPSIIPELKPGQTSRSVFVVKPEDTAFQMGHPDPSVSVLGSPRISLWFEIASSAILPEPGGVYTHVGVGIFVHHLGMARVGDSVEIISAVEEVERRRVVFSIQGFVGERLIALGTHERIILSSMK